MEALPFTLENQKRQILLEKAKLLEKISDSYLQKPKFLNSLYAKLGEIDFELYLIERNINASVKNIIE